MRQSCYEKNRRKLAESFVFTRPIFSERYWSLRDKIEQVKEIKFIDLKPKMIYGKQQQVMLDEVCSKCIQKSK